MFKREREILYEISKRLSAEGRILRIVAYGSRVRGDYRGDSDLDVMVIVDKKDRYIKDRLIEIFYSYELEADVSFSLAVLSLEEFEFNKKLGSPFIANIEKEGMVFYDSGSGREESTLKISS